MRNINIFNIDYYRIENLFLPRLNAPEEQSASWRIGSRTGYSLYTEAQPEKHNKEGRFYASQTRSKNSIVLTQNL